MYAPCLFKWPCGPVQRNILSLIVDPAQEYPLYKVGRRVVSGLTRVAGDCAVGYVGYMVWLRSLPFCSVIDRFPHPCIRLRIKGICDYSPSPHLCRIVWTLQGCHFCSYSVATSTDSENWYPRSERTGITCTMNREDPVNESGRPSQ